jgi:DNA-binding GntR family transcriptional regulator
MRSLRGLRNRGLEIDFVVAASRAILAAVRARDPERAAEAMADDLRQNSKTCSPPS